MRLVIPALLLTLASCVDPAAQEPQSSTQESALTATNVSVTWLPGKMDANSIWPTGQGITSAYVMTKRGYKGMNGKSDTFFAFVVWNTDTVGHIYQVHVGSDGVNFRNMVASATATRTFGAPDHSGGGTGNGDGGTVIPRPHPSGGDPFEYVFSSNELDNVRTNAAIIDGAARDFIGYQ